jgi:hypothetical protein
MWATEQKRGSGSSLGQSAATNVVDQPPAECRVAFCLWVPGPEKDDLLRLGWESPSTLVGLISDLLRVSGGRCDGVRHGLLLADFANLESAIRGARKVQWAIEGFSHQSATVSTGAAILMYSPRSPTAPNRAESDELELHAFGDARPGQILIAETDCLFIEKIPGLRLDTPPGAIGYRELMWQPQPAAVLAIEPSSYPEGRVAAELMPAAPRPIAKHVEAGESAPRGAGLASTLALRNGLFAKTGRLVALLSVGAALLLLVAGLALIRHRVSAQNKMDGGRQISPLSEEHQVLRPSMSNSAEPSPTVASAGMSHAETQQAGIPDASQNRDQHRSVGQVSNKTRLAGDLVRTTNCNLPANAIPDYLKNAERNRSRGAYGDAERQFAAVLACEPANPQAREGMERVRRARLAAGTSARN